jgi:ketosteroid isomerase-like protein
MSRRHLALAALALSACARNIPDTDIRDTADNRAIVAVVDEYRKAFERRDPAAVLALVSPSYYDDFRSNDPGDAVDFERLQKALPDAFQRLAGLRLEIGVRKIDARGDVATVDLFYDTRYRITTPRGEVAKRDSDVNRMTLKRESGGWRIASGL